MKEELAIVDDTQSQKNPHSPRVVAIITSTVTEGERELNDGILVD